MRGTIMKLTKYEAMILQDYLIGVGMQHSPEMHRNGDHCILILEIPPYAIWFRCIHKEGNQSG